MGKQSRVVLLLTLLLTAVLAAFGAFRSIRPYRPELLSSETARSLARDTQTAQYLLRGHEGYIAVFPNRRGAAATQTTHIALNSLRSYDQALLQYGLPAADRRSLLLLLEDLGS